MGEVLACGLADVVRWVDRYWEAIQKQPLGYVHKP